MTSGTDTVSAVDNSMEDFTFAPGDPRTADMLSIGDDLSDADVDGDDDDELGLDDEDGFDIEDDEDEGDDTLDQLDLDDLSADEEG